MDISELYTVAKHEEGAELQLYHPDTEEKLELYLTVVGVDSKVFTDLEREESRAKLEGNDDKVDLSKIAKTVIAWRGFESEGKELKFSHENMVNLLSQSPRLAWQILSFIRNRKNFTKG